MDRWKKWLLRGLVFAFGSVLLGAGCGGAPTIIIDAPLHGIFTTDGSVVVMGRIQNINQGVASVTVNGSPVTVNPDNTWSTSVTLDPAAVFNPILAELVNTANGNRWRDRVVVVSGDSVADGALSPESVALRINDTGLNDLEPLIEGLVDLDVAALIPPGTQIIDNFCYLDLGGTLGCAGSVDAFVSGSPPPSISGFGIDVDSQVAFADGNIDINDLFVRANVDEDIGVGINCTVTITADQTAVDGDYALEPDGSDPETVDVMQLGNVNVDFTNFNDVTSCGGLLGGLVEVLIDLFIGSIEGIVEPEFENFLNQVDGSGNTPIAGAIEVALGGLEIAGPIGAGLGVDLTAPMFVVNEDTQGLTIGADSSFEASVGTGTGQCDAPPGAPDLLASLASSSTFPSFAKCVGGSNPGAACLDNSACTGGGTCQATTPGGSPYGIGICIGREGFNQLLKSQTECGLLVATIDEIAFPPIIPTPVPLTSDILSIFVPQFGDFPPGTPFRVDITPTMAPVVTGNAPASGEIAELKMAQLLVDIVVDDGSEVVALAGAVDATVPFDLNVDAVENKLLFSLGEPDAGDIVAAITVNKIAADEVALETSVLPAVISLLLPSLASDLAEFPLPEFFGLQLSVVEVARPDEGGSPSEFLSIFADLQ